ncbi:MULTISPECIES: PEP/pyruvate-binding domain-containing protein [unclassified Streptomyces]|uniref:PEP/pyruvate-binding domain-containing protein n=1 Tax=unclassified Streptomyces TaxID=2593676 RepID=UPI0024127A78|nr:MULTISPECIES: PEP/pyruvate-binding domain-containing protein [unclassified Streptomyces]
MGPGGRPSSTARSTPTSNTVFKPSLKDSPLDPLVDLGIGTKRRKAVHAEDGLTRTVDTPDAERGARVLDDADVRVLAQWDAAVEQYYECPMDLA